ncbi:MAG: YdaU family protein [Bradyrhizobium sp.]|nr:YdaU family protein [Bradyrhizobium sp.]
MNYYERHLGDYARDAGHLPMIEHGAYTVLLDRYYSTEQPIAADQAYRIARASSKTERAAVDAVLRDFFVLQDGSWHNRRADAEIAKAQTKIKAARENGKRGGRPKGNQDETQQKPTGLILGSKTETQAKALQAPSSKLQEKDQQLSASADADAPDRSDPLPVKAIIEAYNAAMVKLPKVRVLTEKRRTAIRRAWQADPRFRSVDFWRAYFAECAEDDFLNGTGPYTNGHENWRPTIDYLVKTETVAKVFERALDRAEQPA